MGKHIQLFNYSVIFFAPHFGEGTFRSIYIKKIFYIYRSEFSTRHHTHLKNYLNNWITEYKIGVPAKHTHILSQSTLHLTPNAEMLDKRGSDSVSLHCQQEDTNHSYQPLKLKKYEKFFFETESRLSPSSHSMPSLSDSVRQVVHGCKKRECIVATHSPANYHQSSINLR